MASVAVDRDRMPRPGAKFPRTVKMSVTYGFPTFQTHPPRPCDSSPMPEPEHIHTNRRVYDAMAAAGAPLCRPATDQDLTDPLGTVDGSGWLEGSIAGKNVLCLAAGGGRQSSLYAAAGANVTVVDISGAMLELDRRVAAERGFSFRLFEASMDDLSMLADREFDIVIQPVSTCYVPDVRPVFREVARVCRSGAIYVSQHKQPTSLQTAIEPTSDGGYSIRHRYYRSQPVPPCESTSRSAKRLRETGATEFLHRWEELVGQMCRAGFVIEDLTEPNHGQKDAAVGTFAHRAGFVAPYVRIKARRKGQQSEGDSQLWLPK